MFTYASLHVGNDILITTCCVFSAEAHRQAVLERNAATAIQQQEELRKKAQAVKSFDPDTYQYTDEDKANALAKLLKGVYDQYLVLLV